jgi:cholest-4-en-3-one 26-monooxygenase
MRVDPTQAEYAPPDIANPDTYAVHGYPHEVWSTLRRDAPVSWLENSNGPPFWAITKHADIVEISRQPRCFVSQPMINLPSYATESELRAEVNTIIQMDPPVHGVYRQLTSRLFTPRALRSMHEDIEQVAVEILDSIETDVDAECDFVTSVAAPLPIAVIAWILGLPRKDWPRLFDWTNRIAGATDPEYQLEGEDTATARRNAMIEVFEYFSKLVEERRKHPRDDLVTALAQAEVDGQPLGLVELLSYYMILVSAGNETTRNATSGGLLAFMEHRDQWERLVHEPALLPSAVEEILRWTSPVIHMARTATEDVRVGDQTVRAGEPVAMFYPSANRDEEVFDDPFAFRIDRRPNRHLALGIGEHFCLGAHLARLELTVIFRHLARRLEWMEPAGEVERLRSNVLGGLKHLPVRYRMRKVA